MSPTIIEGDRVVIEKSAYDFFFPFLSRKVIKTGTPSRGDIVTLGSRRDLVAEQHADGDRGGEEREDEAARAQPDAHRLRREQHRV